MCYIKPGRNREREFCHAWRSSLESEKCHPRKLFERLVLALTMTTGGLSSDVTYLVSNIAAMTACSHDNFYDINTYS